VKRDNLILGLPSTSSRVVTVWRGDDAGGEATPRSFGQGGHHICAEDQLIGRGGGGRAAVGGRAASAAPAVTSSFVTPRYSRIRTSGAAAAWLNVTVMVLLPPRMPEA
jgi:hypothetical protein